jgi:hypothetical protein
MVSVRDLRDKANRYYRLSRSVGSDQDVALLQKLGAEADQAANDMEAEEARQRARGPTPN